MAPSSDTAGTRRRVIELYTASIATKSCFAAPMPGPAPASDRRPLPSENERRDM